MPAEGRLAAERVHFSTSQQHLQVRFLPHKSEQSSVKWLPAQLARTREQPGCLPRQQSRQSTCCWHCLLPGSTPGMAPPHDRVLRGGDRSSAAGACAVLAGLPASVSATATSCRCCNELEPPTGSSGGASSPSIVLSTSRSLLLAPSSLVVSSASAGSA